MMRGRISKPWYRSGTGTWYTTLDGRQVLLGRTEKEAKQVFEKIAKQRQERWAKMQIRNASQVKDAVKIVPRVYFIQDLDTKHIKIGLSDDPKGRLKALQIGNHSHLRLLGSVLGLEGDERHLHRQFRGLRVRGEWFRGEDPLLEEIKYLLAKGF